MNTITEAAKLQRRLATITRAETKAVRCEGMRHCKRLVDIAEAAVSARTEARGAFSADVLALVQRVEETAPPTENVTDDETDFDA